jgi:hypothetical protein
MVLTACHREAAGYRQGEAVRAGATQAHWQCQLESWWTRTVGLVTSAGATARLPVIIMLS